MANCTYARFNVCKMNAKPFRIAIKLIKTGNNIGSTAINSDNTLLNILVDRFKCEPELGAVDVPPCVVCPKGAREKTNSLDELYKSVDEA